jgi:hypothetical protein
MVVELCQREDPKEANLKKAVRGFVHHIDLSTAPAPPQAAGHEVKGAMLLNFGVLPEHPVVIQIMAHSDQPLCVYVRELSQNRVLISAATK